MGIDKECLTVFHESFNMYKICVKMVLKLTIPESKDLRIDISANVLNNIVEDLDLLYIVFTCDEFWFFTQDSEIKRQ